MQVILLEKIAKLGAIGDEVTVKDGFARNYLLPQNKALRASAENRERFQAMRDTVIAKNADQFDKATALAEKLADKEVILIKAASEAGQLYGSAGPRDIVDGLAQDGLVVERAMINIADPIKSLGIWSVKLQLHGDVVTQIKVNVAKSKEEAIAQRKQASAEQKAEDARNSAQEVA
ncbi:MAG: 50S ribosomal protein L9 [Pseudomonadota bacterium]